MAERINGCERGKVNNGPIARFLPDVAENKDRAKKILAAKKKNGIMPKGGKNIIEQAAVEGSKVHDN